MIKTKHGSIDSEKAADRTKVRDPKWLEAYWRQFDEMIDVARSEKYRRVVLNEITFNPDGEKLAPDMLSSRVMCQRLLEWNL